MSNFTDAKSFIVKAKKISKTRDVQILELLFDMKVSHFDGTTGVHSIFFVSSEQIYQETGP